MVALVPREQTQILGMRGVEAGTAKEIALRYGSPDMSRVDCVDRC